MRVSHSNGRIARDGGTARRRRITCGVTALLALGVFGTAVVAGPGTAGAAPGVNAALIVTTGHPIGGIAVSSGSFTATVAPAFSPTIHDYTINCPATASSVTFTMSTPAGTISYKGQTGTQVSATVSLVTNQAAVVRGTNPTASTAENYWFRCLPTDFPKLAVTTDTGQAPNGYYLTQNAIVAPGYGPYVMVLDKHGTPIWWQKSLNFAGTPGAAGWFQVWSPNVLGWDSASNGGSPNFNNAAGYTLYNLSTSTSSTVVPNNAPADGHEIVHLSDGNILFLTDPEVTGVDLTAIGDGTNQNVADCAMQETTPTGQVLWSWDSLSHIGIDESVDPISDTVNGQKVWDIFHCNGVSLQGAASANPETANIVLSSRENSSIYLIDRSTGNVIWKVGGNQPSTTDPDASAQFLTVQNDPEGGFFAQHNPTLTTAGELTLFDDHSGAPLYSDPHETPGPARGVQYKIDTTAGTATLDQSYVAPDNESSLATGSYNRYSLPGGATDNVVGWGFDPSQVNNGVTTTKLFSEVTGNGHVMLAVDFVDPTGGGLFGVNDSYRVIKVPTSDLSLTLLHQDMGGLR